MDQTTITATAASGPRRTRGIYLRKTRCKVEIKDLFFRSVVV